MAYYGGEEQRKKDENKKKVDSFMNKVMPKRTFDQMGRETDRRTGKLLNTEEQFNSLFDDPLEELWALCEDVMPKPNLQSDLPSNYEGPHKGQFEHPVTKMRNEIDSLIAQGEDPATAHQSVHGDIDPADVDSKAKLASTFGRLQDDGINTGIKIEKGKGSILAKDAAIEKRLDQVTHDDLRTPMNQEVPDRQQTPQDQVAEELDYQEEMDYNDDVAYLQKYGRA
mgnify:CR=1 FL=1